MDGVDVPEDFISHYVQIKPGGFKKRVKRFMTLYPTTFR